VQESEAITIKFILDRVEQNQSEAAKILIWGRENASSLMLSKVETFISYFSQYSPISIRASAIAYKKTMQCV
jgi:hypothetical protein